MFVHGSLDLAEGTGPSNCVRGAQNSVNEAISNMGLINELSYQCFYQPFLVI